jgi:hypothetical protein
MRLAQFRGRETTAKSDSCHYSGRYLAHHLERGYLYNTWACDVSRLKVRFTPWPVARKMNPLGVVGDFEFEVKIAIGQWTGSQGVSHDRLGRR